MFIVVGSGCLKPGVRNSWITNFGFLYTPSLSWCFKRSRRRDLDQRRCSQLRPGDQPQTASPCKTSAAVVFNQFTMGC